MSQGSSANVARYLAQRVAEEPDRLAVLAPCGREANGDIRYEKMTYRELHAQSEQVAHGFKAMGLRPGERTLLMVRPGSDLIRCCFALFKTGAVPVVIDPGMGLRNFLASVRRSRPAALVGIPLAHVVSRLFPSAFRGIRHRIKVGSGFARWYETFPEDGFPIVSPGPEELAAILFTSGSTGPPKGVCYGHGQFDSQVKMIRETYGITPGEVDLPMLPIFALFNPAMGMTTVVPEMNPAKPASVDPEKILQAIRQCGVTNSFGSPVLWRKIARHAARTGETFPSVRRILMAGAPVPPVLVERLQPVFPRAELHSPYGATECLPVSDIDGETILRKSAARSRTGAGTCVGRPVEGVAVRILRIQSEAIPAMDGAEELPAGEIGEIIATGPTVTTAYDALPEATAKAKIADGQGRIWHRMGDAGYLDAEGRLWFCGRIAERVLTPRGPLYTDCVEGIFNALRGVARSALIGLGEGSIREPAIVIEPDPDHEVSAGAVLSHAGQYDMTRDIKRVFFDRNFPVDVRHNAKIHRLTLSRRYRKR